MSEQPASSLHADNVPGTTETGEDNQVAPLQHVPERSPAAEIDRLQTYLEGAFAAEMGRTNVPVPEGPVDVAIRLLNRYSVSDVAQPRCSEPFCNKPRGHRAPHGTVNY